MAAHAEYSWVALYLGPHAPAARSNDLVWLITRGPRFLPESLSWLPTPDGAQPEGFAGQFASWPLILCLPDPWPVQTHSSPLLQAFDKAVGFGDSGMLVVHTLWSLQKHRHFNVAFQELSRMVALLPPRAYPFLDFTFLCSSEQHHRRGPRFHHQQQIKQARQHISVIQTSGDGGRGIRSSGSSLARGACEVSLA